MSNCKYVKKWRLYDPDIVFMYKTQCGKYIDSKFVETKETGDCCSFCGGKIEKVNNERA